METKIKVISLCSSSSGNAYYLNIGGEEILVDVGISAKGICDKLHEIGTDIQNIKAIFITHEHFDHTKGLAVLSKKHEIPIHMTRLSAIEYMYKHPEAKNIFLHDQDYICDMCNFKVKSFFSSHDSCACVGYTFESADDKFGIATDMGYVDKCALEALVGCNSVVLESNYDENMLKSSSYPENLKDRIRSSRGHLSNFDCAALAYYLAERGTKNFMLGHLSEENNSPEIALTITTKALKSFSDVKIIVADKKNNTFFV